MNKTNNTLRTPAASLDTITAAMLGEVWAYYRELADTDRDGFDRAVAALEELDAGERGAEVLWAANAWNLGCRKPVHTA
jgi:hypothetical protein